MGTNSVPLSFALLVSTLVPHALTPLALPSFHVSINQAEDCLLLIRADKLGDQISQRERALSIFRSKIFNENLL